MKEHIEYFKEAAKPVERVSNRRRTSNKKMFLSGICERDGRGGLETRSGQTQKVSLEKKSSSSKSGGRNR